MPLDIAVQIEEEIQTFAPADNGAGPLWCHGSTIVARAGRRYVPRAETLPDQVPPTTAASCSTAATTTAGL